MRKVLYFKRWLEICAGIVNGKLWRGRENLISLLSIACNWCREGMLNKFKRCTEFWLCGHWTWTCTIVAYWARNEKPYQYYFNIQYVCFSLVIIFTHKPSSSITALLSKYSHWVKLFSVFIVCGADTALFQSEILKLWDGLWFMKNKRKTNDTWSKIASKLPHTV